MVEKVTGRASGELGSATIEIDGVVHVMTWTRQQGVSTLCGDSLPYDSARRTRNDLVADCLACIARLR